MKIQLMEPNIVGELHGHVHYKRESCKSNPPCKPLRRKTIEKETVILPTVVADAVIGELARYLHNKGVTWEPAEGLADKLANKAERYYAKNPHFHKRIRSQADQGRAGRDWLCAFMRHWLSAEFPHGSEIHRNLPEGFCVGKSCKGVAA